MSLEELVSRSWVTNVLAPLHLLQLVLGRTGEHCTVHVSSFIGIELSSASVINCRGIISIVGLCVWC